MQEETPVTTIVEIENRDERPLLFRWSDPKPIANQRFNAFRDSLLATLDANEILEITGIYYRDEENPVGARNLGEVRAEAIRDAFANYLPAERMATRSEFGQVTGDLRNKFFEGARFRTRMNTDFIKEVEDHVLIYFPFNSTKRLTNAQIDHYMTEVAERVLKTGEHVQLTGFTDDLGTNESNYYLGLWRAEAMRDILIGKGVEPSRVQAKSMGELNPIASNRTSAGKKQNRRVELRLIAKD